MGRASPRDYCRLDLKRRVSGLKAEVGRFHKLAFEGPFGLVGYPEF